MPVYNNKEYIRIVRPLPSFVKRDKRSIPFIEPVNIDISDINNGIWLINSKNANSKDKNGAPTNARILAEKLASFFKDNDNVTIPIKEDLWNKVAINFIFCYKIFSNYFITSRSF